MFLIYRAARPMRCAQEMQTETLLARESRVPDVYEAHPRGNVGEFGDAELVGAGRGKLSFDEIQRPPGRIRWERRALLASAHRQAQAFPAHQPFDRAACARKAFAVQLPPRFATP